MTRQQIIEGLEQIALRLGNEEDDAAPLGFEPHEWAYLKGIASHAVLQAAADLRTLGQGWDA